MRNLQASLRALADSGRSWAHLGQVTAVTTHEDYGYLLDVVLRPSGVEVQARPVWWMGGAQGEGIYAPIAVDDEVVVVVPDGDLNRALAWPGPPSSPSKPPSGWSNDRIELVHAGGVQVRSAEGNDVEAVVLESLLPDLQNALTEVQSALAALGLPTTQLANLLANLPTGYRSTALKTE